MEFLQSYIVEIWYIIIGFFLLYYVLADGADLGVGILSLFSTSAQERGILLGSLQHVWQDNQTWLIVLAGMLFGAFPIFYSLILSSLYVPIMIMLLGLILRGVSFEFRIFSDRKRVWGLALGVGSAIAAAAQGFAAGSIFGGLATEHCRFAGDIWDWLNPFSALVAFGLLCAYTTLGANYLILKTEGNIQKKNYRHAATASVLTFAVGAVIELWIMVRYPSIANKWTVYPYSLMMMLFQGLTFFSIFMYYRSLLRKRELAPLLWSFSVYTFAFVGLSTGYYPYIIPDVITIRNAAASSPETLLFMLVVTAVAVPVILIYTGYKHWVFRGKSGQYEI
ncbi:MAG: cytochrome d ubiquinol oxidase subunit II [Syntrophales bacterium]